MATRALVPSCRVTPIRKERTTATQDTPKGISHLFSKLKRWSVDFTRFARQKENDMRNDRNIRTYFSDTGTLFSDTDTEIRKKSSDVFCYFLIALFKSSLRGPCAALEFNYSVELTRKSV